MSTPRGPAMSAAKVIAEAAESYFNSLRRDEGYIVDGVDGDHLADSVILALYDAGWRVIPEGPAGVAR